LGKIDGFSGFWAIELNQELNQNHG